MSSTQDSKVEGGNAVEIDLYEDLVRFTQLGSGSLESSGPIESPAPANFTPPPPVQSPQAKPIQDRPVPPGAATPRMPSADETSNGIPSETGPVRTGLSGTLFKEPFEGSNEVDRLRDAASAAHQNNPAKPHAILTAVPGLILCEACGQPSDDSDLICVECGNFIG
jgi:hypothetical protein